ncbi:ATP-binding cassette domain-containing protein [Aquicoccus sp. SCR17]|nr:ATP-binding cassette domain-containing protein [Carideicomes alvinocaridis]
MSGTALQAQGLEAGYGALQILFGIDLTVGQGEHVLVFGPNGAGKSTLIKALFGLVAPSAGQVTLAGRDVTGQAPERMVGQGMAYVPQVSNVFGTMSVQENLEIGGASLPVAQRNRRIEEMVTLFPVLGDRRKQAAGTLSGGERQMLALARALIPEPSVLLLDEPSAGVAPKIVEEIFLLVSGLRQTGVSVLMIEQNARQALPHVDRGYVLESGQVRMEDSAAALRDSAEIAELYLGG